jgi:low temperature requirement protein LtrA
MATSSRDAGATERAGPGDWRYKARPDAESSGEAADEQRVRPLELLFDLVFVFAVTQVTTLMARNPTWHGLGHGLLVLGALWWAWASYSWLTNSIDPEQGGVRLVIFAAMAAMLVASLATPLAFSGNGVIFGCAYLIVRALHVVLYVYGAQDHGVRRAVLRLAPSSMAGSVLLVLAGIASGGVLRIALWCLALAIDYLGVLFSGTGGWRVSAGHFAERYGLIVLIAIGESVVAIGAASGRPLDAGTITAAVLGMAIAGCLWWAYFDVVAIVAERRLRSLAGPERARLARDSYSYLHLLMVTGIVLVSVGIKQTLADVSAPLHTVRAVALCGGVALYLVAHILFRLRNVHSVNRPRVVAAALCVALIPAAASVEALIALATVAAVLCVLIAYEAIAYADARARVRNAE